MTTMAMNQGIKIEHTLHIGITSRAFNRSGQTESYLLSGHSGACRQRNRRPQEREKGQHLDQHGH